MGPEQNECADPTVLGDLQRAYGGTILYLLALHYMLMVARRLLVLQSDATMDAFLLRRYGSVPACPKFQATQSHESCTTPSIRPSCRQMGIENK